MNLFSFHWSGFFEFLGMVSRIDLVSYNSSFFLKIFQVNMVGNSDMICRSFEEFLLVEETFLLLGLSLFLGFNLGTCHRTTEKIGIGILSKSLIADIFHIRVQCL